MGNANTRCKRHFTYLLSPVDAALGDDDDFVLLAYRHHLGHAVGVTAVVDVARGAAAHGGVDHLIIVYTEHVRPAVLWDTTTQAVIIHIHEAVTIRIV